MSCKPLTQLIVSIAIIFLCFTQAAKAQDYTITTTGNAIVITDVSGNGETLGISESGANLSFSVTPTTRTYAIDGGPVTAFTTPADIPLAGVTSITANAGAGNDFISISAFTANLPSLTINGGTGDDAVFFNGNINFSANANLDLDLQNDEAIPGIDQVQLSTNAQLILSGTGAATIKVSKGVNLSSGNILRTENGDLTIEANQQATATTANFLGVWVNTNSLIEATGTGQVTVKAKGGTSTLGAQYGVFVSSGGKISGGTTGTVTVVGTGGASTAIQNHGVFVNGTTATITSAGANVSVTGQGGGSGTSGANYGVHVLSSATISAGGGGTVTVLGTGGAAAGNSNIGVYILGANALITSNSGNVSVTGQGGNSPSPYNYGLLITTAGKITAGGSGTVTVLGTGGAATGDSNYGVDVTGASSTITSNGGNVIVTGQGGGSGASGSNIGVDIESAAAITAGGSGTVTVIGTGGASTGVSNVGIYLQVANAIITSNGGNVSVTGQGGGSGASANNFGVLVAIAGTITAGGNGTVTVFGTGGAATGSQNNGVCVGSTGSNITSNGGNISVTGQGGGSGSSLVNSGLYMRDGGTIKAGGSGTLTVFGTGGASTGRSNHGVYITGPNTLITSTDGNISVTGTKGNGPAAWDILVELGAAITSTGPGGDITITSTSEGTYPNTSGADITTAATKTISFGAGSKLNIGIDGTTVNTQYQQLNVVGMVDLTNATLTFTGSTYTPVAGNIFTIVDNDGTDAVVGTFAGLAEGATITNFLGSVFDATITYAGGTGNDVVITVTLPDYTITTTGNAIVIIDNSGNSETLNVSESGTNIRFSVTPTTRTYTINGGAITAFSIPADIALAGVTSITANTGAGNDMINVGAFTASLPSLTINGGIGDDAVNFNGNINFATNANLDVDLQNDDAIPGVDSVSFATNAQLILSGTGAAIIKVSKNVNLPSGNILRTENGDLTIETNQQTIPTSGNFIGVAVNTNSIVEATSTGLVTLKGKGGTGATGRQYGIQVLGAGKISGGTTGTITLLGTGGGISSGAANYGVQVTGTGSIITSNGGNVSVTGQGGSGGSNSNFGIYVLSGAAIRAGGSGTLIVIGTGGATAGSSNIGVYVTVGAFISSADGNVNVTGQGGGNGISASGRNYGVYLSLGGHIEAGSTIGDVTVVGTGGSGTGSQNIGVYLSGANANILSAGGNISVTGTKGTGTATQDILIESEGYITSNGFGGDIILTATSGGIYPNTSGTDIETRETKTLSFGAGSKLNIDIDGTTVNTQYQQLSVVGMVDLTNATLTFTGSTYMPVGGETFTIVDNDVYNGGNNPTDAITGTFAGLPEGAIIPNFLGSSLSATISYVGGKGNDVVITVINSCTDPDAPTLSASVNPACAGSPTTLSVQTGTLNSAANWQWYTGSCGGTSVGSGTSINVSPSTTTTYYARGEGGCVTPGSCANITITVNSALAASVNITAAPAGPICSGTPVTFTATPANGGASPTYQWSNGGVPIAGATGSTYTSSTLANNDLITVSMTATPGACLTGSPATSTGITITVNSSLTASVGIAAVPAGAICSGTPVTFTATPTNGGTSATYQWNKGGIPISGATGSTYTSSTLANNDVITVSMTATPGACLTGSPATSTGITITVNSSLAASVSIAAVPAGAICSGTPVTFTATPTNGGASPAYQWKKGGLPISGATGSTYTSSTLANNDVITVSMTATPSVCLTGSPATSNGITITVNSSLAASVSIAAVPAGAICSGTPVTFTATPTNGGASPAYQWKKGGLPISGATGSTYTSSTLANNDVITVSMTATPSVCLTGSPATSNGVTIAVNSTLAASVNIAAVPAGAICSGTPVTFTAIPTNGGVSPTYQWKKGGVAISGATSSTYTSSTLANNDVIAASMTSTPSACLTGSPATSTGITMVVNQSLPASVKIAAVPSGSVCAGTLLTFTATPTNGGTTPAYQWKKGGVVISGATGPTYTSSVLANNDVITVVMTSSPAACISGGLATSAGITVAVIPAIVATATAGAITCYGGTTTLTITATGGTGTLKYSINGGTFQTSNKFTVTAGTYTATVSDGSACTKTITPVIITQPGPISISLASGSISCYGATTSLMVTASGGTAPFTYSVNGCAFQNSNTFTVNAATCAVTVRDAKGCIVVKSVIISQPAAITVTATATPIKCYGGTTSVIVTATGGTPGFTGTGTFIKGAGTYTFVVTDSKGCKGTKTITITQPAILTAGVYSKANITCYGTNTGSITLAATGGAQPYTYKINTATNYQSSCTLSSLAAAAYSITVKDNNSCAAVVSNIIITQPSILAVTLVQKTDVSCLNGSNGSIKVSASGGTTSYKYSLNSGTYAATGAFTSLKAGTYTVNAKDVNGCIKSISVVIKNGTGSCNNSRIAVPEISMAKEEQFLDARVSPNPSATEFILHLKDNSAAPVEVRVINLLGQTLHQARGTANQSYKFGQAFVSGMYIVEILQDRLVKNIKVVKN